VRKDGHSHPQNAQIKKKTSTPSPKCHHGLIFIRAKGQLSLPGTYYYLTTILQKPVCRCHYCSHSRRGRSLQFTF